MWTYDADLGLDMSFHSWYVFVAEKMGMDTVSLLEIDEACLSVSNSVYHA